MFGQRGFVTRVILASSDVSKISSLDEEVTDLLRDFQVSLCHVVRLCDWVTVLYTAHGGPVHPSCHPAVALWPRL